MNNNVSSEIVDMANEARADILPEKSKKNYEIAYASYVEWKDSKSLNGTNEIILLAYFKTLSEKYKPPTLWSHHSMLKSMICLKEKINIDKFLEVSAYLKKKSHGYISKKSKVFTTDNVENYLNTASDNEHLDKKVSLHLFMNFYILVIIILVIIKNIYL